MQTMTLFDLSEISSTPPPSPSRTFWKVYRITPPTRFASAGSLLVEGSTVITDCPDEAIAEFRSQLEKCEAGGLAGKACTDIVMLVVQTNADKKTTGRVVYRSCSGGKVGRSRISPNDPRVILPASKQYGELVSKTWGWHPKYINGLDDCVTDGSITREQRDDMLALRTPQEISDARKALQKQIEKEERAAAKAARAAATPMRMAA